VSHQFHVSLRYGAAAVAVAALGSLAACSSGGSSAPAAAPVASTQAAGSSASASASTGASASGTGDTEAIDALVTAERPAAASAVAANSVAAQIRKAGVLEVGGVQTAPLFSLLDPSTGQLSGFDAGIEQLLAKYIIGADSTKLVEVTSATREAVLENHSVNVVVATYTITAPREKEVGFAGPYFGGALGVAVPSNSSITSLSDLAGMTVVTESGSTIPDAIKAVAPTAKVQLFDTDAECVQAVLEGRADAYVLDQGVLAGDALANPGLKVLSQTFDPQPYGIGVPLDQPSFKAFVNTWLKQIEADGTWAKLWKDTLGTVIPGNAPTPPAVG
jgi:glutamate transport system substrate-binding protein